MDDMRQLVRTWSDAPVAAQRESGVRSNILNKGTRTRLADGYQRAFLPRFVSGPIPEAWKLVRPLEDVGSANSHCAVNVVAKRRAVSASALL